MQLRCRSIVWKHLLASICGGWVLTTADYNFVSYDYGYVAADNSNPTFTTSSPVDGAKAVPIDSAIATSFSETIVKGRGEIVLSSPIDTRRIPITDPQVTVDTTTNRTLLLLLSVALRTQAVYDILLPPGLVMDHAGNNFQGGRYQFSTAGLAPSLLVFSPFIQAPDSPVMFSFRTSDHCLYGSSADEGVYHLALWPSGNEVFHVPAEEMEENCARVLEVSDSFPAIESCHVRNGRFEIVLRQALHAVSEFSCVIQWPVLANDPQRKYSATKDGASRTEVFWNLLVTRTYSGTLVEVERLEPFQHKFGDYLFNNVDDSKGAVLSFSIVPASDSNEEDPTSSSHPAWLGNDDTKEFLVHLTFGSPGLQPSSRILLFAQPLTAWSINPSLPHNMSTLQLLTLLDPHHLSDPLSRGLPCLHVLPTSLPFGTQCRNLELGLSGYSYGLELQLPVHSLSGESAQEVNFHVLLPGTLQSLALVSRWEVIQQQPAVPSENNGWTSTHSSRKMSSTAVVLNTTNGLSLEVLSSNFPYPAPVGTRVNRVELEYVVGLFVLGALEVYIELLEPSHARFELCEPVEGAPRIVAAKPNITDEPIARVTWSLQHHSQGGGADSAVAFPRTRYRSSCLIYNGPHSAPLSHWRLGLVHLGPDGQRLHFSRTFVSSTYFVATTLAGAQVTPTMPLLARHQAVFVRVVLPIDDNITLRHWTAPARHLWLLAPSGFDLPLGPCLGFKPLTSSALPPIPLTGCMARPHSQALVISIDPNEPGFEPGQTYAFRVTVGNPQQWDAVQSRSVGGVAVQRANQWSIRITSDEGHPLALLADVPPVYSEHTAALRPEYSPGSHDTSFRIYQRLILFHEFSAENSRVGEVTRVWIRISLSTTLRLSDRLQITAPSSFSWVLQRIEHTPETLRGTVPFPAGNVEPGDAPWIVEVVLAGEAIAATPYSLVLNITNPAVWSTLDQDLNFWTLETFYDYGGILDKRSRRDVAVRQGYLLTGALTHCDAVPLSRTQGEDTWVSLTLKVGIPVFAHRWSLLSGPSALHIRIPRGYHFAGLPTGKNCTGLLMPEAVPDSPRLPTAQFPHGYSPLAALHGLECTVDGHRLETSRTLMVSVAQQDNFGILPHILYAFRLHVKNPSYDRIFDAQWTFSTVGHNGDIYEQCAVHSLPTFEPALASLVLAKVQVSSQELSLPLPTQQMAVTFVFGSSSPISDLPGLKSMVVLAPAGFVFLRHRIAVVEESSLGAWELLARDGRGAEANLLLQLNRSSSPLSLTVFARVPSQPLPSSAALSVWTISITDEGQQHSGYQTAGLTSPATQIMEQFTLQPEGVPFFRLRANAQQAVLTLAPSVDIPAGGLFEVRGPRHDSFTFDADRPCEVLRENPETLGHLHAHETSEDESAAAVCNKNALEQSSCHWPLASSCIVSHGGTRLAIRVWRALQGGRPYCFQVRLKGPPGLAGPMPPIAALLRGAGARTADLSPSVSGDESIAPFVREVRHLFLCYRSRAPGAAPRELTVRFLASGMGRTSGAKVEGRICINGATLLGSSGGTLGCRIEEPASSDLTCVIEASSKLCRGVVCVALRGSNFWASSPKPVLLSLMVHMLPRIVPRVDLQLFDSVTTSVVQGSTASLDLPVLDELIGLTFSAPRTASTAAPFLVTLRIDWESLGAAFLKNLVETEEEEVAFLDVSAPLGLSMSLSCKPIACKHLAPTAGSLRHALRLVLGQPAPAAWWRVNGLMPSGASAQHRRLDASSSWTDGPLLGSQDGSELGSELGQSSCEQRPQPHRRHRRLSTAASSFFNISALPPEVYIHVTATRPLTPRAADSNVWEFVLRSRALRALGAVSMLGFGVAAQMQVRLEVSSRVAGDVFSRLAVTLLLEAPLSIGDVISLLPPASADIPCRTEAVEPVDLVAPSRVRPGLSHHLLPGACLFEVLQTLRAGIRYSFSVPLQNPAETPEPNMWLVHTYSKRTPSTGKAAQVVWETHSVAEAQGFEVFGAFTFFSLVPKSAAPAIFSPAMIHFQLRTPFPTRESVPAKPGFQAPPARLRIALLNGSRLAQLEAFDPSQCLLDVFREDDLVEPVEGVPVLLPNDCLVTDNGAAVEFLFQDVLWARQPQVIWTRLRNPTQEAHTAAHTSLTYEASTFLQGSAVHRTAVRPIPPWGVQAEVRPGSLAAGVVHRATVVITAGKVILGQRGAIEVTLPWGFTGSCTSNHFRPRPALPLTARCDGYRQTETRGSLVIVHWRTLFRTGGLRPPYEFAFELTNGNYPMAQTGSLNEAWHIRIFEGDHRELLIDGTPPKGLRPFELCPLLSLSHRREDAQVISITFNSSARLADDFEKLLRVELRSSARAPASLSCPETSLWQERPSSLQGMPTYTSCVPESPQRSLQPYEVTAEQHVSSVLFLLPFGAFFSTEPFGLEVVMERIPGRGRDGLSASEAAAEMLGVRLESRGVPQRCASVPLGNVSAAS